MPSTPRLILGSGSPRRLDLLAQIGLVPDAIRPPDIDETPLKNELPRPYNVRISKEKLMAIPTEGDEVVLCADTTVAVGRRIFGKPETAEEARGFLNLMSGRRHRVITTVAVKRGENSWLKTVQSQVQMKRLSTTEIDAYLATEDWRGKAGGWGIQGPAGAFIPWISGSFSAIVGLPLAETASLLQTAGFPVFSAP
ncbi:MAG: nucleoside triphosphate pyrophosphatase [Sedimentitalea sp.]